MANRGNVRMKALAAAALVFLALLVSAPAFAAGNGLSKAVYHNRGHKVQHLVTKPSKTTSGTKAATAGAKASTRGTLPFTGLDLGVVAGASLLLVGTGFTVRKLGRKP